MSGLEADTIGGYNSMIDKQKTEEGEALRSTVLFDGQTEVLLIDHEEGWYAIFRPARPA